MDELIRKFQNKRVLILGFGREGRSTYEFIRKHIPDLPLWIADRNSDIRQGPFDFEPVNVRWKTGTSYLDNIESFDLVIKSPGVALPDHTRRRIAGVSLTSQSQLFLELHRHRTIGITGTKGKSTTSALVRHLFEVNGVPALLIGNIGVPPLSAEIAANSNQWFVFEMSSNQLEDLTLSPHIAVLLNLYPEHLDRYSSVEEYYNAKCNIFLHQDKGDCLIFNHDHDVLKDLIGKSRPMANLVRFGMDKHNEADSYFNDDRIFIRDRQDYVCIADFREDPELKSRHNILNLEAAALAARSAGLTPDETRKALPSFPGLPHRLEYIGRYGGIRFYNDSISTIPESTIFALETLDEVDTLILGGHDRSIDYGRLVRYIEKSNVMNVIMTGPAGVNMHRQFVANGSDKNLFYMARFEEAFRIIPAYTKEGSICLLSPAASSYDQFNNFEERGELFKKKAGELSSPADLSV